MPSPLAILSGVLGKVVLLYRSYIEVTNQFKHIAGIDNQYLTCLCKCETDVMVIAFVTESFCHFGQFIVSLHVVFANPSSIQSKLQDVVTCSQIQSKCILLGLDCARVPFFFLSHQSCVTGNIEFSGRLWLRIITTSFSGDDLSFATVRTITDVELVLSVLQLDVEVVAAGNRNVIAVIVECKTIHRPGVERYYPSRLISGVVQLTIIACLQLHVSKVLDESFVFTGRFAGKID